MVAYGSDVARNVYEIQNQILKCSASLHKPHAPSLCYMTILWVTIKIWFKTMKWYGLQKLIKKTLYQWRQYSIFSLNPNMICKQMTPKLNYSNTIKSPTNIQRIGEPWTNSLKWLGGFSSSKAFFAKGFRY